MSEPTTYRWRRSVRARQLQVRITPWQGIEVVIPTHTSKQRVRAFLAKQRQWIRNTWAEMHAQIAEPDRSLPVELNLRAVGEHWPVRYRRHPGGHARVTSARHALTVWQSDADEDEARRVLHHWLARHARRRLGSQAAMLAAELGFSYRRLQIRGQTSRWGSCSSRGTLSLNYKLLFLPPRLVRYLLIHELSHTRVLSHSARFWKVVERYEPNWREYDRELGEAWREVPAWVELA
ncbi:MAG: M48 family metallopeptidase [Gammaproteobacteria bacterium]